MLMISKQYKLKRVQSNNPQNNIHQIKISQQTLTSIAKLCAEKQFLLNRTIYNNLINQFSVLSFILLWNRKGNMGWFSIMVLVFGGVLAGGDCLICNGDFEQYGVVAAPNQLQPISFISSNYSCWYNSIGGTVEIKGEWVPITTAMAELSHSSPYTLCQDVVLQTGDTYQLKFSIFNVIQVQQSTVLLMINSINVKNQTTVNNLTFANVSYTFIASANTTQICFSSVQTTNPVYLSSVAACLDNITLENISNATLFNFTTTIHNLDANNDDRSQTVQVIISFMGLLVSFPLKLPISIRYMYLFMSDIWLYGYNTEKYTGLIQDVFKTIMDIQLLKFQYFQRYLGWSKYKSMLGLSDYLQFTMQQFVKVEGSSSVFIDANFTFFVYTLPQNVLFCVFLYLLFRVVRKYKIRKYIRKFYFLKTVLAMVVLEENLDYFVFVCFSHLQNSFSFKIYDKLASIFTILFLCGLILFTCCFYMLTSKYLGRRAGCFADFTYRENAGFWYKTLCLIIRNLLRAKAFYFFHYQYVNLLLALSLIEVIVIFLSITIQSLYKIFLSKAVFALSLIYSFIFILFNFSLLLQHTQKDKEILEIIKKTEEVIIYSLIGVISLVVFTNFLPSFIPKTKKDQILREKLKKLKKLRKLNKKLEKQVSKIVIIKKNNGNNASKGKSSFSKMQNNKYKMEIKQEKGHFSVKVTIQKRCRKIKPNYPKNTGIKKIRNKC